MLSAHTLGKYLRVQLYVIYSYLTDPELYAIVYGKIKYVLRIRPAVHTPPPASTQEHTDIPVDLVYTWVDGTDPEHFNLRQHWARQSGQKQSVAMESVRFKEIGELKLSLRSVERYLPWVRHIYIVTNNQTPSWLDTSHPKIRMVSIDELFPEKDWLPSFNSHAIEFQLHRIPGLSEHFIYCCDDNLFGSPCSKEDFFVFSSNGDETASKVKLQYDNGLIILPSFVDYLRMYPHAIIWRNAWNNLKYLLEHHFPGQRIHYHITHQAVGIKKSVLTTMVERFPQQYRQVSATKFRSMWDIPPIGFACHLALLTGHAQIAPISSQFFENLADFRAGIATKPLPKLLCINNFCEDIDICEAIADLEYCNSPSSFEKKKTAE
jgi:hypothetical protein